MDNGRVEIAFQRGDKGAIAIQSVINELIEDARQGNTDVESELAEKGIDPSILSSAKIEITEDSQGIEPILTTIIVGISVAAGSKVAETLWTEIIWPRIARKLGVGALGKPKSVDQAK